MSSTIQKFVEQTCDLVDLSSDNDIAVIKTEQASMTPTSKSMVSGNQIQKTPADVIAEEIQLIDQLHEKVELYNFTSISSSNTPIIQPRMQTIQTKASDFELKNNSPSKLSSSSSSSFSSVDSMTSDQRSVYVGSVDYSTTVMQLKQFFKGCGGIQRAKIISNPYDGKSKGFAYIEFMSVESVELALALNGTYLNGRMIIVLKKRTNRPGLSSTNRIPRGFRGQAVSSSIGNGTRAYSERLYKGVGDSRYKIVRNPQGLSGHASSYTPY